MEGVVSFLQGPKKTMANGQRSGAGSSVFSVTKIISPPVTGNRTVGSTPPSPFCRLDKYGCRGLSVLAYTSAYVGVTARWIATTVNAPHRAS